jgi:hypothetical protein
MSCDAVSAAAYLFLASASPAPVQAVAPAALAVPHWVGGEPLFKDIAAHARELRSEVDGYRKAPLAGSPSALALPHFDRFEAAVANLSDLDMQGHVELAKSGADGDLKCILKGISQDLAVKLRELKGASTGKAQEEALRDMRYLLNDNVEVITSKPKVAPTA